MFPGVAAGVVDPHRGPGDEFLRDQQVVLLERIRTRLPDERGHPHDDAARTDRNHHQRAEPELTDLRETELVLRDPRICHEIQHRFQNGLAVDQAASGEKRRLDDIPGFRDRLRASRCHRLLPRPSNTGRVGDGLRRFLTPQDRLQQIDDDEVGEARHRHVRQVLSDTHDVEAAADACAGVVEQRQPLLRTPAVGDVDDDVTHPQDPPGRVVQPEKGRGIGMLPIGISGGPAAVLEIHHRYPGLEYLAHPFFELLGRQARQQLTQPPAEALVPGHAAGTRQRVVQPHVPQLFVQQGHADRRLGEHASQHRLIRHPPGHLGIVGSEHEPARTVARVEHGEDSRMQVHAVTVRVDGGQPPVPTAVGTASLDLGTYRRSIRRPVEQGHGRTAEHVPGGMADHQLGSPAPPDHRAPPVEDRAGNRRQPERVGASSDIRCPAYIHRPRSYPRRAVLLCSPRVVRELGPCGPRRIGFADPVQMLDNHTAGPTSHR